MGNEIKWYEKNYITVLCFISIIFIPLGIYLVWKNNKLNRYLKIFTSLATGLVFLAVPCLLGYNIINGESEGIIYEDCIENFQTSFENNSKSKMLYKPPKEECVEEISLEQADKKSEKENTENKPEQKAVKASNDELKEVNFSNDLPQSKEAVVANNENKSKDVLNKNEKNNEKEENKPESQSKKEDNKQRNSNTVYVTAKGKRYHYKNPCGKGSFRSISLEDAVKRGYTPCKKCVK